MKSSQFFLLGSIFLRSYSLEDILDDQRVDILGDKIEEQVVSQPLGHGVPRVLQTGRDQLREDL